MDGKPETVIDTFIQVAGGVLWHATGDDVSVEAPTVSAWNGAVGQGLGTSLPALMRSASGLPAGHQSLGRRSMVHNGELSHIVAWYN